MECCFFLIFAPWELLGIWVLGFGVSKRSAGGLSKRSDALDVRIDIKGRRTKKTDQRLPAFSREIHCE